MGVFVKLASAHVALSELLFYRGATTAAVTALIIRARGERIATCRFGLHAARGVTGFVALAMFFQAMKELPLGTAVTLNYTSPVHMAALSASTIPRGKRLLITGSVVLGFLGTVLLLKPAFARDQVFAGIIGTLSGFMSAITYFSVRSLVLAHEPEMRVVFYYAVITAVGALLWIAPTGFTAIGGLAALQVSGVGLFGTAGQIFMTRAYGKGDTLIVATLSYTGIIFSTMLGIAVWSDPFSLSSWFAMVMIVVAGVMAMTVGKNAKIEAD